MTKKRFWHRFTKSEPAKPTRNIRKANSVVGKIIRWFEENVE